MSEAFLDKIKGLNTIIETNPYNIESHDNLINLLRIRKSEDPSPLHEARIHKLKYTMFSEIEISQWKEDLESIQDLKDRQIMTFDFYELILLDYPVVKYWKHYLQLIIDYTVKENASIDQEFIKIRFQRALQDTVHDFKNSPQIWDIIINYHENLLDNNNDQELYEVLLQIHMRRVSYPHCSLEQSFSNLSSFISKYHPESYDEVIKDANQLYRKTEKLQRYYDDYEIPLRKNPEDLQLLTQYLLKVHEYATESWVEVKSLFYRILSCLSNFGPSDERWLPIWKTYICIFYKQSLNFQIAYADKIFEQFVRAFPQNSLSYTVRTRNIMLADDKLSCIKEVLKRIFAIEIIRKDNYEEWKDLVIALLGTLFQLTKRGENLELVDVLYAHIDKFCHLTLDNPKNLDNSVELFCTNIFQAMGDIDSAKALWDSIINFNENRIIVVKDYVTFISNNFNDDNVIRNTFANALSKQSNLNCFEALCDAYISFEQLNGDIMTLHSAEALIFHCRSALQSSSNIEIQETDRRLKRKNSSEAGSSKKPKNQIPKSPARNREFFTTKITGIPNGTKHEQLVAFFESCGEIRDIKMVNANDANIVFIEWSSEEGVFAALTKNFKKFGSSEIKVTRAMSNTIWVANFPPSFNKGDLEALFSSLGQIVSIRLPSLHNNPKRRFCYVEYVSAHSATEAVSYLNGKRIEDPATSVKYSMVVKISQSENKATRSDNLTPERQIYVKNLDYGRVTKEILQEKFEKFGKIEQINIPLNDRMKNEGKLNNGYAFILFEDPASAKKVLDQADIQIFNRKVIIESAKRKRKNDQDCMNQFEDVKTITIFHIDDTARKEQVESFLNTQVTGIEKIEVLPKFQAALVQFENQALSGKAAMKLEGIKYLENTLAVGTKFELYKMMKEYSAPK